MTFSRDARRPAPMTFSRAAKRSAFSFPEKPTVPGPKKPKLTRAQAMACRPRKLPILGRETREKGGAQLRTELARPQWLRWLTGSDTYERRFGLDAFGVEVYDACDGRTPIKKICRVFSKRHKLNIGEAEEAVTRFVKMLMTKGLIVMVSDERVQ
jgi:hypothetical protein